MLNLYATPTEIKAAAPGGIQATTVTYDSLFLRLANQASRFIDRYCRRVFFPRLATRYFNADGKSTLFVGDLLSVTTVSISTDNGLTYTDLVADTDYRLTRWGDHNDPRSWATLEIDPNSTQGAWPTGYRAVKVLGVWGYADDRDTAWENSTDDVLNNPLAAGGVTLNVTDADGADALGLTPRFQAGQLLRMGSEYAYGSAVVASTTNQVTIVRACNGTVDAAHVLGVQIDIWRPPEPVKQAAVISVVRLLERGLQGFGDSRANAELGQMIYLRALDPEARALLDPYRA